MYLISLYFFKLSISLAVFWLFYRVLLRSLTFYSLNRVYLILYPTLAFLIPFFDIESLVQTNKGNLPEAFKSIPALQGIIQMSQKHDNTMRISSSEILITIFWAGFVLLLLKLLIQFISLRKIRSEAVAVSSNKVKVFYVSKNLLPFSFGNSIYLNPDMHTEKELEKIIRHEYIHVRQKHSRDILFAELLCIVNWYNPFSWLIRQSIRQNLEFIADDNLLQNGTDRKEYQYLLLKVVGNQHFSIVNQFNFISLKKRITMMNKIKSTRAQLLKFLFVLPLVALLLLAFRNVKEEKRTFQQQQQQLLQTTLLRDTPPKPLISLPALVLQYPEDIANLSLLNNVAIITFKDGRVERYDLKKASEKSVFMKKYKHLHSPEDFKEPQLFKDSILFSPNRFDELHNNFFRDIFSSSKVLKEKFFSESETPKLITQFDQIYTPVDYYYEGNTVDAHIKCVNGIVTSTLHTGKKEMYDLKNPGEKKYFIKKYGGIPERPLPPEPPASF